MGERKDIPLKGAQISGPTAKPSTNNEIPKIATSWEI